MKKFDIRPLWSTNKADPEAIDEGDLLQDILGFVRKA